MINYNADVAEGFGVEELMLPFLDRCNVSCGAHAGTPGEIQWVIELAIKYNVKIGAHPSFEDRDNFGRLSLPITAKEIYTSVYQQVFSLYKAVRSNNGNLSHVKPHGALYHQACFDVPTAEMVLTAVQSVDRKLSVVGLPNSVLESIALQKGIGFIREGFADRAYNIDGSLVERSKEGAVMKSKEQVLEQVKCLVYNGGVKSINGEMVFLDVDTICFHGDTEGAVDLLKYCFDNV